MISYCSPPAKNKFYVKGKFWGDMFWFPAYVKKKKKKKKQGHFILSCRLLELKGSDIQSLKKYTF